MIIRSNFGGYFIANGAKAAPLCRFGTTGLSGLSDFATLTDSKLQWRMTMKKLMMTAAFIACASPAFAGSFVETTSCRYSWYYGYRHCSTTYKELPAPVRNPEQERLDAIALQKEDAKWEAFCKPTFRADQYGVRRASYAVKGCEFGRSE